MHVVIMGCGRVGSALAKGPARYDHSVAIIDRDAGAFRRLPADFDGQRVTGVGFDRDTLVEAGIERAHGFAAVSSGDNSNIIAARVARETFGVENVVARIYDARRAEVYQKLGIPSVATVRWTADQVIRRMLPEGMLTEWRDPSGQVVLAEIAYSADWTGHRLSDLEEAAGVRVALHDPTDSFGEDNQYLDQLHALGLVRVQRQTGRPDVTLHFQQAALAPALQVALLPRFLTALLY